MTDVFRPRQPEPESSGQKGPERKDKAPHTPEQRDDGNPRQAAEQRIQSAQDLMSRPEVQTAVLKAALEKGWVKSVDPRNGIMYLHYVGNKLYMIPENGSGAYRRIENGKYTRVPLKEWSADVSRKVLELRAAAPAAPTQKSLPVPLKAAEESVSSPERAASGWDRRSSSAGDYDISGTKGERRYLVFLDGRVMTCPPGSQKAEALNQPYPAVVLERRKELKIGDAPEAEKKKETLVSVKAPEAAPARPVRKEKAPEVAAKSSPTPESIVERFRSMEFKDRNGKAVSYAVEMTPDYFRKNSILNLADYQSNMVAVARSARDFIAKDPSAVGALGMTFDGNSFRLMSREGGRTLFTPVGILTHPGAASHMAEWKRDGKTIDRDTDHPAAARYDVYTQDGVTEYVDKSGALKIRERRDGGALSLIEYFNGGNRPSILNVIRAGGININLSGPGGKRETYALSPGIHFVPESGAPISRFEGSKGKMSQQERDRHELDAADIEEVKRYADMVASTLKTPQAIMAFVTSNLDFVARVKDPTAVAAGSQFTGGVVHADETGQNAQHPLKTLYRGAGDCEDTALVIKYLCGRAKAQNPENGATAFVAKTNENHYAAYTIEEYKLPGGAKAYGICKMHSIGFERYLTDPVDGTPFRSANEALSTIWKSKANLQVALDEGINAANVRISDKLSRTRLEDIRYRDALESRITPELREFAALKQQLEKGPKNPEQLRRYGELRARIDWRSVQMMLVKDDRDINGPGVTEGPAAKQQDWMKFVKKVS